MSAASELYDCGDARIVTAGAMGEGAGAMRATTGGGVGAAVAAVAGGCILS